MTVRLLAALGQYPANAIVTFAAAVETSLVAEKLASTDLTGGVEYQAPVDAGRAGEAARWVTDADGNPVDLLLPGAAGRGGAAAVADAAGIIPRWNKVYLLGDSNTMRMWYSFTATAASGVSGTTATWAMGSQSYIGRVGGRVRVVGNDNDLDGFAVVSAMTATSITVDYGYSVVGLTQDATVTIAVEELGSDTGWAHLAQAMLALDGYDVEFINVGRGGDTASDMLGRLDEIPDGSLVAVAFGSNDMASVAAGTTTQAARVAEGMALIAALRAKQCRLVVQSPPPFTTGLSTVSASEANAIAYLKEMRKQERLYVQQHVDQCRFADVWTALKSASTDYAATGVLSSNDNIHLAPKGAWLWADEFVSAITGLLKTGQRFSPATAADGREQGGPSYIKNPMLLGTGGTKQSNIHASSVVPDSWIANANGGTATITQSARELGGNDFDVSWVVSGSTQMQLTQNLDASVLGKTLRASVELEHVSGGDTFGHYLAAVVQFSHGGQTRTISFPRHALPQSWGGQWPKAGQRYRFESVPFTIPADATGAVFRVLAQSQSAGTLAFKVGCPDLEDAS